MRHLVSSTVKRFLHRHCNSRIDPYKNDMTNIVPLTQPDVVSVAAQYIRLGKVIAIPTDTVYGLAADLGNPEAVQEIYKIKGRDFKKPIAVCVGQVEDIKKLAVVDSLPNGLLSDLLPGPVTVLLDPIQKLRGVLGPNVAKVGVRVPDSGFVRQLALQFHYGLALTSANESASLSCLVPEEFKSLWPHLGLVVDGGRVGDGSSREGSTIVELIGESKFKIVRTGSALSQTVSILLKHGLHQISS